MAEWKEQVGVEIWEPTPGEQVEGTIQEAQEGPYGAYYIILRADGSKIRTPSHKVLQSRLVNAKVGDKVRIVAGEKEPPKIKGHQHTQLYRVWLEK